MSKKITLNTLTKALKGYESQAAALRDKIRDLKDQCDELEGNLDTACDSLTEAREALEFAADTISRTV